MLTRKELERLHSTVLAAMCQNVADVTDGLTADVALSLKREWARLQTPPSPNLNEERAMDAKRQDLRLVMLDFLEGRSGVDYEPK